MGERRLKNVALILEWKPTLPSPGAAHGADSPPWGKDLAPGELEAGLSLMEVGQRLAAVIRKEGKEMPEARWLKAWTVIKKATSSEAERSKARATIEVRHGAVPLPMDL